MELLWLSSIILGLSVAIPVGPITVEMIRQGLKRGFLHGWSVGLGGMTVDVLLMALLYFGASAFMMTPVIQQAMWIVGAAFLFYVGIVSIKEASAIHAVEEGAVPKTWLSSYANGFMVAVSPGNIVFWLSVFGTLLADKLGGPEKNRFLVMAAGVICGILIHDIVLMLLVTYMRKLMNGRWMKRISVCAGLALIYFGGMFVWRFVQSL
ncbi:LysE family transporter [Paenibacillus sp. VCA1]|uniref:LysE family translocator n=1 Tax=Paenibacillus sp. VCA1 TaxID=3039148 RepID=UPI002870F7C1|nr:LysE family transporter [Paenibacillus sp. VCA1]MDR9852174.1 LysE family transporter [Paenibacillus sp. VCA1]